MPRIAFLSSTFPDYQRCGTGIYAGYLTRSLAQQGYDIHVVTTAIPEIRSNFGKVTIHKIMESWSPLELYKLVQLFYQIKPDILHINHPTSIAAAKSKVLVNMLPEINRHLWKLPVITTLHEFGQVSLLGKLKIWPMLISSDMITVTNLRYKEHLEKVLPKSHQSKICIVNIGSQFKDDLPTSADERLNQRARWDLRPEDKVVGFVGFITPPKGFHNLIEAAAPLLRKDPRMKILALSSWNQSTSAYRQKIIDQIHREGISRQVIFTGFLEDDDLWNALSAIDVCAFAFDYPLEERSSGPLRQAIFKGIPTLVFAEDLQYNEFGFKNEENILFSPFKNITEFRRQLSRLLEDKALAQHISEGSLALRHEFSFDKVSNEISRLYSKLISKGVTNY